MQSGPDVFDKSKLLMTYLTSLRVREIWRFSLVLEKKAGKDKPESSGSLFSEKFLVSNFALSDAEGSTSGLLNRGDISD